MWSYTSEESAWLNAEPKDLPTPAPGDISPETIRRYVAKGRYLRAAALHDLGQRLARAFRRLTMGDRRVLDAGGLAVQLVHDIRTPLTSIRSYSEILRNHPELSRAQRDRYLEIIVSESRRLELAVSRHEARTG